jgi:hypothetical protein
VFSEFSLGGFVYFIILTVMARISVERKNVESEDRMNGTTTHKTKKAASRKIVRRRKKEANGFEIDQSPTARAAMKAFRMTHQRLHGAKATIRRQGSETHSYSKTGDRNGLPSRYERISRRSHDNN